MTLADLRTSLTAGPLDRGRSADAIYRLPARANSNSRFNPWPEFDLVRRLLSARSGVSKQKSLSRYPVSLCDPGCCESNWTEKQIAASRRNALMSTGPSSSNGKARSAQNALTHGLTS